MSVALAALFGLALGSFLTVVIDRVPRRESIVRPGSRCPNCRTAVGQYDNIPVVSWLILRGRCRACGEPIPARYVVLELATAALFVLAVLRLGVDAALPALLIVVLIHVAATAIEWQGDAVPATAGHLPAALALVAFGVGAATGDGWSDLLLGLLAAAASGAALAGCRTAAVHVELGMLTALALGYAGVPSLALGGAVAVAVALVTRHRRGTALALTAGLLSGLFVP